MQVDTEALEQQVNQKKEEREAERTHEQLKDMLLLQSMNQVENLKEQALKQRKRINEHTAKELESQMIEKKERDVEYQKQCAKSVIGSKYFECFGTSHR